MTSPDKEDEDVRGASGQLERPTNGAGTAFVGSSIAHHQGHRTLGSNTEGGALIPGTPNC